MNAAKRHPVIAANLLFFAMIALGIALYPLLLPGPSNWGPSLGLKMLVWDGRWYFTIAVKGYSFNPLINTQRGQYCNMAFFPLYPLIEKAVFSLTQSRNPYFFILPGVVFGLASNLAFLRLARTLQPEDSAAWATALFAVWPAGCFLVMGYPTGLINLCLILSFTAYIRYQYRMAALWCGIGTAAGPTMVFIAAGLILHQFYLWHQSGYKRAGLATGLQFGLLSVSGLICFMAYQQWKFNDMLAFQQAQTAWAASQPLAAHLRILFNYHWIIRPAKLLWSTITSQQNIMATPVLRNALNDWFQWNINEITCGALILAVAVTRWRANTSAMMLATIALLAGYIWFNATTGNFFWNGMRLLYPAWAVILLSGGCSKISERQKSIWLGVLFMLGSFEFALVIAGYTVI